MAAALVTVNILSGKTHQVKGCQEAEDFLSEASYSLLLNQSWSTEYDMFQRLARHPRYCVCRPRKRVRQWPCPEPCIQSCQVIQFVSILRARLLRAWGVLAELGSEEDPLIKARRSWASDKTAGAEQRALLGTTELVLTFRQASSSVSQRAFPGPSCFFLYTLAALRTPFLPHVICFLSLPWVTASLISLHSSRAKCRPSQKGVSCPGWLFWCRSSTAGSTQPWG